MMYGRKSEIQRIQAKLQRIGKANPYRPNLNGESRHKASGDAVFGDAVSGNEISRHKLSGDAVSGNEISRHKLSGNEISRHKLSGNEISRHKLSGNEISRRKLSGKEISRHEISGKEISRHEISGNEMHTVTRNADQNKNLDQNSHLFVNHAGNGTSLQPTLTEGRSFISTYDRYHTPAGQQALKEMGDVAKLPDPLPDAVTFSPQDDWVQSSWTQSSWPSQISIVDSEAHKSSHQLAHNLRQQRYASDSSEYEKEYVSPTSDSVQVDWNREAYGNSNHPHEEVGEWLPGHIAAWGSHSRFSLTQGLMWLVGAVVIRMGIDRLLGAFPNLWVVMAAMVLTPVAIALYQTAVNPQATVHSGRRLLVIMMGLLIGGQL